MDKINVTQKVKLFHDEEDMGTQEINIDTNDECGPWMTVSHCGDGFSLSVENWNQLVELFNKAKLLIDAK